MPETPFIPPLNTPDASPYSALPVIPSRSSSGAGGSPNMHTWANYPIFSPYQNASPYIPSSPFLVPGVIPNQNSRSNPRPPGLSPDWTGYPQGTPFSSPTHLPPGNPPQNAFFGPPPPLVNHPPSPWYPHTAPAGYPAFGGTPWPAPPQQFATPWGPQPRNLPPQAQAYTPWMPPPGAIPPPAPAPPPPGWGSFSSFFGPQDPGPWPQSAPPINPPPVTIPREPGQVFDKLDPFLEGDSYGPVLDSKLVQITGVQVQINPLLTPVLDDGPDHDHLRWNMSFPTSTIQRSTDPPHVSWSKGRSSPATFPRLKELRIISETTPWIIEVKASNEEIGITCAEVVEAIAKDLYRNTGKADFEGLQPQARNEVRAAYKHNRSTLPNVPGGVLGVGLKRLDFLRRKSNFGGIEVNERVIRKIFNSLVPAVVVLKSRHNMMTKEEVDDQQKRMTSSDRERSKTPSSQGKANSTHIAISSPTATTSSIGD